MIDLPALANVLHAHQPRSAPLGGTVCACGMTFKAVDARAWHRHAAAMVANYLSPIAPTTEAKLCGFRVVADTRVPEGFVEVRTEGGAHILTLDMRRGGYAIHTREGRERARD